MVDQRSESSKQRLGGGRFGEGQTVREELLKKIHFFGRDLSLRK
jgi:hypothetical protein